MWALTLFTIAVFLSGISGDKWYPRETNSLLSFDQDARLGLLKMQEALPKFHNMAYLSETNNLQLSDDIDFRDLVKFCLYTRLNKDTFQQLYVDDVAGLKASNLNLSNPTKVLIHGYINDINSEFVQSIKNDFLSVYDYNIIGVDWGLIANTIFYNLAAEQTQAVGDYTATFLDFLVQNGVKVSDLHLIGHSLGAHAAGFAGGNVTFGKIPRITGLDPAKPWFTGDPANERLDKSDAVFVDCIHTCGGYLGLMESICHSDFYPNGGADEQPGCLLITLGVCSHGRSHELFTESILPTHKFYTTKCPTIPNAQGVNCTESDNLMGYYTSPTSPGIYYTKTNGAYPFSLNVTGLTYFEK